VDLHKAGFDHGEACDKQEIVAGADVAELCPDGCPHETFQTVTLHSIAQATSCSDPDLQAISLVFPDNQHNKRVGKRLSRTPHPLEFGCFSQSKPAFHLIDGARSCWVIIRSQ